MSLTRDQAVKAIDNFVQSYLPQLLSIQEDGHYDGFIKSMDSFTPFLGIDGAYTEVMNSMLAMAAIENSNSFTLKYDGTLAAGSYVKAVDPAELVSFLYSSATPEDQQTAISLIQQGALSNSSFAIGLSIAQTLTTAPSPDAIKSAAATQSSPTFGPFPRLDIQELTDSQQDFLTSVYVGAFGRAPEYEGLMFWARDLIKVLPQGEVSAFNFIGEQMYIAGAGNNEGGTHLPHADYIHFAYNNVLGREAEPDGYNFWLNELNSGAVNRGNFIATFIGGVGEGRDATYLDARLAVASYVAQEHVSGRSAPPIDLRGVLNGVVDMPSAAQTIEQLEQIYLVGNAPANDFMM